MFRLVVEAEVRPTEDPEKVSRAIGNILPESQPIVRAIGSKTFFVEAESNSVFTLSKFHSILRRERILDAARRSLLAGVKADGLDFNLNKQAAFAGRVSFCGGEDESPLGSLYFSIHCPDPRALIEWLAPKTAHGKPMSEPPVPTFNP